MAALDSVLGLIDMDVDVNRSRAQVIGSAFSAAYEFDQQRVAPLLGQTVGFNLRLLGKRLQPTKLTRQVLRSPRRNFSTSVWVQGAMPCIITGL